MDGSAQKKQRAESVRQWLHTTAVVISALVPIALAVIQAVGT